MLVAYLCHQVLFSLLDGQQLCSFICILVCLIARVPVHILACSPEWGLVAALLSSLCSGGQNRQVNRLLQTCVQDKYMEATSHLSAIVPAER